MARRSEVARLLRNEGATYNVTGDVQSRRQPWSLDPCALGGRRGRVERPGVGRGPDGCSLLDLVVADVYGDRRLVAERADLPAELVLGHPGFLRACVGMDSPAAHADCSWPPSTWYGTDRAGSGPSGDRAQAPSGLGYALVNRSILSRVLPNLHRESGVERLAGFFRSIRAGVAAAAPEGVDEPRVVILTPGPLSATYFEHAYLASYLGYALVEGRDLVVNNNRVWLRTLAGFDPVDVVIRRVDDEWCDPVELRADSLLGVPGLMEVDRRGRVAVVNPLGAGVVENPALTGSSTSLAPVLLGEDLALRGPETVVVRSTRPPQPRAGPARPAPGRLPVRPSPSEPPVLAVHAVRPRGWPTSASGSGPGPGHWVGQEIIQPSTVPTVTDTGTLEPRPGHHPDLRRGRRRGDSHHGFRVLPGGLTRVGADPEIARSSRAGAAAPARTPGWPRPSRPSSRAPGSARPGPRRGPPVVPDTTALLPDRVAAQLFVLGAPPSTPSWSSD